MEWYYWAALALGALLIIRYVRRSSKGFAVATNALLAEHFLSGRLHSDPSFRQALVVGIHDVLRAGGFPGASDDMVERMFNKETRFVQLNIIALALERMGHLPAISGEIWYAVRNPFIAVYNLQDVQAVADRVRSKSGVSLLIATSSLCLSDGDIANI